MQNIRRRALLIGINYKGQPSELKGCINDVLAVKKVLVENFGYQDQDILLLTDDTLQKPTHRNILLAFRWLLTDNLANQFATPIPDIQMQPNTTYKLFFHYSGHGGQSRDQNNDESDRLDETLIPIDYMTTGEITDDVVREILVDRLPENAYLNCLVDSCHSATSLDLCWNCTIDQNSDIIVSYDYSHRLTKGRVVTISGCRDTETSADVTITPTRSQGALTNAFLTVLNNYNYQINHYQLLQNIKKYIVRMRYSNQNPCISFGGKLMLDENFSP